uniref:C-type lectin domain-containing protein n=1 Tax=Panagrolaimus davidi TaxID=227884 RepID=A0A914PW28_9BILA
MGFSDGFFIGHFGKDSKDYWIGLSNIKAPKKLAWTDGTKVDFVEWDKNQPGNVTGIKCASVTLKTGYWKVESCFQQKAYVCEIKNGASGSTAVPPMTTTTGNTAPPTTTASAQKCTGNFTYYGPTNSCYGVFFTFDPDARGWNASETFCQSINGHLASIHSQDEFNFIMNFNYPQNSEYWPWVGLFSNDNEQTFQWSDGTPTDFLPWGPGEPVVDTNFNCVFANSEGIDTLDCSEPGTALCKIKLN